MHLYIQQPNGGKKYVCSTEAKCKSNQRHFMKNTTTALYKHFLHQYPLRRGKLFFAQVTVDLGFCVNIVVLVYCAGKNEALLRLQAIAFVSLLMYLFR